MNVVKKITIAAAFLCAATVANAQDDGLKIGARGSYSFQNFGGYEDEPIKSFLSYEMGTVGAGFGIALSIPAGPISIAPEVAFLYRKNYTMKFTGESEEITQSEFAVSIPVLIRFFPVSGLFIQAGVQVDIPIAAELCGKENGKEECRDMDGKKDEDGDEFFKRATVDFGIPVGFGYLITPNVQFDFRYVIGLLPAETWNPGKKFESAPLHSMNAGMTYFF